MAGKQQQQPPRDGSIFDMAACSARMKVPYRPSKRLATVAECAWAPWPLRHASLCICFSAAAACECCRLQWRVLVQRPRRNVVVVVVVVLVVDLLNPPTR